MDHYSVFVGTVGQGLIRIKDGKWSRCGFGVFDFESEVRAILVHPTEANVIFVGDEEGLFRSADGGTSWEKVPGPLNGVSIWSLACDPSEPKTMFAGTRPPAIFRSDNSGLSWTRLKADLPQKCVFGLPRITSIAVDPLDSMHVWATVEIGGVFRSIDGGTTWSMPKSGIKEMDEGLDIHNMQILPNTRVEVSQGRAFLAQGQGSTVLIVCQHETVATSDNGATWHSIVKPRNLPEPYMRGLATKPNEPTTIYMGIGRQALEPVGKLVKSGDGGLTWEELNLPNELNSGPYNIATHPSNPNRVWVATIFGQIYNSEDAGRTWVKYPRETTEIRALTWRPD